MNTEITSQKIWDEFVLRHSPQALFQSWQWGEVEKKMGHKIWRWGWFAGGKLAGVAQMKKVTARRGTFLHIRHGPVGRINFNDVIKLAKTEKAWFIRVSPQMQDDGAYKKRGFMPAPIHAMDAEFCWVLDLDKSEEELMAGMRKTTRYEIKRAQKLGVTIHTGFKDFLSLYKETSRRQGFVGHSGIKEEIALFAQDALVLNASYEGKTLASAIILFWGDEAIYHHGASLPGKIPASYLLQWEAIREAKKRGKKVYNFWGIAPEDNLNHPWRGLTLFKTGFGGRQMRYMHAMDLPISPLYVIPKIIETIRKRLKGY
jgi:lipid II:glycine glycyltransferase (peptidoglycan interpeptide bridge formation enzyme)